MLLWPIDAYKLQKEKNTSVLTTMKYSFSKFEMDAHFKDSNYTNQINDAEFTAWYRKLLEKTLHYKVSKIELYSQQYVWGYNKPEATGQPIKEICIATY
jgi:hypothetical protein